MTLATAIAAETGTSKEIYDILKARTVPVLGVLPGANLQAVPDRRWFDAIRA